MTQFIKSGELGSTRGMGLNVKCLRAKNAAGESVVSKHTTLKSGPRQQH